MDDLPIDLDAVLADWDLARTLLLPTVRDGGHLACALLEIVEITGKEPRIAHRAIAPGLFATLVIDLPDQM